jgi:hypothetical protein
MAVRTQASSVTTIQFRKFKKAFASETTNECKDFTNPARLEQVERETGVCNNDGTNALIAVYDGIISLSQIAIYNG